ncbi:MAG: hypothetical protein AAGA23_15865 [Pseudomonadota bacterium]
MFIRMVLCFVVFYSPNLSAAVDINQLWVRGDLAASEQRMRSALADAEGDDALIIQTQMARVFVFRRDFRGARDLLIQAKPKLGTASRAAKARYWLEFGRTYASHQHQDADRTSDTQARARVAFETALALANDAGNDGLAVDALHMFAFVDRDPADQLRWNERALARVESSSQKEAKRWEASIRNNLGETLFELRRFPPALTQFERALALGGPKRLAPA